MSGSAPAMDGSIGFRKALDMKLFELGPRTGQPRRMVTVTDGLRLGEIGEAGLGLELVLAVQESGDGPDRVVFCQEFGVVGVRAVNGGAAEVEDVPDVGGGAGFEDVVGPGDVDAPGDLDGGVRD